MMTSLHMVSTCGNTLTWFETKMESRAEAETQRAIDHATAERGRADRIPMHCVDIYMSLPDALDSTMIPVSSFLKCRCNG